MSLDDETALDTELSRFTTGLTFEDIPSEVVRLAVRGITDTVGVGLAGIERETGSIVTETISETTADGGETTILGSLMRASLPAAIFVNATAAHCLDFDDSSLTVHGHPSVSLVPVVLALAERRMCSGREMVTAYVAGMETQYALASTVGIESHVESGWHATSTLGTFGATAAAVSLLELSPEQAKQALNAAASLPSGLKRNFGTMTKPMHVGHAARSGAMAAMLAKNGFTAARGALGEPGGFTDVYAGTGESRQSSSSVGDDSWAILGDSTYHLKKYPCCASAHAGIDAAQTLKQRHDFSPRDVETVHVSAPTFTGEELRYDDPDTELQGRFSMQHAIACAILREQVGLAEFRPATIADPEIESMRTNVQYDLNPEHSYGEYDTSVGIETTDGESYDCTVRYPPGTHERPLSDDELHEKFIDCATQTVSSDDAESSYAALRNLTDLSTPDKFLQYCRTGE